MLLSFLKKIMDSTNIDLMDKVVDLYAKFGNFAPLLWIILPWFESIFSPLPLTMIVAFNITSARGLMGKIGYVVGYLCSFVGEFLGAVTVFCFYRYLIKPLIKKGKINKKVESKRINNTSGRGPLFVLTCVPFFPTALINLAYGLSSISLKNFVIATFLGKLIMIFLISFCAPLVELMMSNIIYLILGCLLAIILWYVVKKNETKIDSFLNKIGEKLDSLKHNKNKE